MNLVMMGSLELNVILSSPGVNAPQRMYVDLQFMFMELNWDRLDGS